MEDENASLKERGVDPASRNMHVLGSRQWPCSKRLLCLAGGPGTILARDGVGLARGGRREKRTVEGCVGINADSTSVADDEPRMVDGAHTEVGGGATTYVHEVAQESEEEFGGAALSAMLEMLEMKEAIYDDASKRRPSFPGGPDDYRRNMYQIDWETKTFSVSVADRKANGEGPSQSESAGAAAANF